MALLRSDHYHPRVRKALRKGRLQPTAPDDCSGFRYPPRDTRHDMEFQPSGSVALAGDLLAFGWQPLFWVAVPLGLFVSLWGLGSAYYYAVGVGDRWGISALVFLPLGLLLIWYGWFEGLGRTWRLIIFDRKRGLVHLPRWFSPKLDAVRFGDLDVLVVRVKTGYHGMDSTMQPQIIRPGWNFWRGEFPPWWGRMPFLCGAAREPDEAEWTWRQVVRFMTEPLEASPWAVDLRAGDESLVEDQYKGNWKAYCQKTYSAGLRLYGSLLLAEPNWQRDVNGDWYQTKGGAREKVLYPDGPCDKREPAEPGETGRLGPLWQS